MVHCGERSKAFVHSFYHINVEHDSYCSIERQKEGREREREGVKEYVCVRERERSLKLLNGREGKKAGIESGISVGYILVYHVYQMASGFSKCSLF